MKYKVFSLSLMSLQNFWQNNSADIAERNLNQDLNKEGPYVNVYMKCPLCP